MTRAYPSLKSLGTSGDTGDNQYLQGSKVSPLLQKGVGTGGDKTNAEKICPQLSPPAKEPLGTTQAVDSKGLSPLSPLSPLKNDQPQKTRGNKTLADLAAEARGTRYAEWRAAQLNELFDRCGALGEPGGIKPETIMDGLEKQARRQPREPA